MKREPGGAMSLQEEPEVGGALAAAGGPWGGPEEEQRPQVALQ